jgi:two-component system, NarL family, nitrate/nitrite response regulator NarL
MEPAQSIAQDDAPSFRCTRILVISDVLLYREGLSTTLAGQAGLQVSNTSGGMDAATQVQALAPDVVLLDASLPDSLARAREVRRVAPGVRIVGFGVNLAEKGILACAEAGLVGFVGKDGTIAELVTAIEQAMRGEVVCSPHIVARLFDRVAELACADGPANAAEPVLTRREQQVAQLIKEGLSNKEIAAELRVGVASVKRYVHLLLEKFQVPRRSAIAARIR